jgi:hypothetical protein
MEQCIGKKRTLAKELMYMKAPVGNQRTVLNTKEHKRKKDNERKKSMSEERIVINFQTSMRHLRGAMKGPHRALVNELLKMDNFC